MPISNSPYLAFWPLMPTSAPMGTLTQVWGYKWWAEEIDSPALKADRDALGAYFNIDAVGGNVNFSMINDWMDIYFGEEAAELGYCPVGWVAIDSLFFEFFVPAPYDLMLPGDLPDDAAQHMRSMAFGMFVWQRYRLKLAQQVEKLTRFHKRGRPLLPP